MRVSSNVSDVKAVVVNRGDAGDIRIHYSIRIATAACGVEA